MRLQPPLGGWWWWGGLQQEAAPCDLISVSGQGQLLLGFTAGYMLAIPASSSVVPLITSCESQRAGTHRRRGRASAPL